MKNIPQSLLLATAILLAPSIALAEQSAISGPQLYASCASPPESQGDVVCQAYIMGIFDGLMAGTIYTRDGKPFCDPENVSGAEERRVVEKFMREHPEHLHDAAAAGIILLAFYTNLCVLKPSN